MRRCEKKKKEILQKNYDSAGFSAPAQMSLTSATTDLSVINCSDDLSPAVNGTNKHRR